MFLDKIKVLTSNPARQHIAKFFFTFCICSCLHCSNLHLVFTKEKEELTILTTKHGLLTSYRTRKICFLSTLMDTKNLLNYKSENLFSDHRSKGHHSYLLSYMEDLFSYHKSCPLAIPEIQFNILS